MSKKIAVIDGNSLMHRAYHAVQTPMTAKDGTPTNAVFGFLTMLCKFIEMASPDAVVCAFDAGKPVHRIEAMAQYKAQRPPMDEELHVQFPVIQELLESMAIPVVKVPGWEGDDILGTIAARDEALGYETLLVTGDKDAYQLASELTRIVTTKKGITDVTINGPAEVEERYGVTPAQFIDYLGLMGDSSDNIPGVPGIGPKTATKLLQTYGSMEGIYEHVGELKGKQKENIENNRETAFLSREIATIVTDLDFPLDLEAVSFPAFDAADVEEAFGKYQLASPLARVLAMIDAESPSREAKLEVAPVLEGDAGAAEVARAVKAGETIGVAFVDPEQVSLFDEGATGAFATDEATVVAVGDDALALLAQVVREGSFVALDVKAELHRVYPADTAEPALVSDGEVLSADGFDLSVAGYVLNSSLSAYTYDSLVEALAASTLPEAETDAERATIRATAARLLKGLLEEALKKDGSWDAYADIDLPLVGVLAVMERVGAAIDAERLEALGREAQAEVDALTAQIYELAGEPFNLSSPKQLAHILFEVLELPPVKKNQRGYSTDAKVLTELSAIHPLPDLILRYREFSKIKNTYIDALPRMRAADGRVHTQFNETVTTTGRLSSSDPNLQNIPVRTEFGRQNPQLLRAAAGGRAVPVGGLLADRAAPARASVRRRALGSGVQLRGGFPRLHGLSRLRSAGGGGDTGAAQPRQGGELRHRLRPAGLRTLPDAGHPRGRGPRDDRPLLRGVPRRAHLLGRDRRRGPRARLRRDHARPQAPHSRAEELQRPAAGLRRAHGHEPSHAGERRRHHQDGHERGAAPSSGRGL